MIYMDVDTALSEVPVNAAPLIDDTDFKTPEEAIAYNAAGMDLEWHFTTTAGVTTVTAVTPTTAGNYDWAHQGNGMYTIEIPASGGASINNDTEGFGRFVGQVTGVLPFVGPWICFRAAALNNADIDGGDLRDVNVTTISDTAQTARDIGASVLLSSGTGTGQVLLSSGTVTAGSISTDAVSAAALATDAVQEIRNAITGGAYAMDTDANGRVRIVDGTAAGELDTNAGLIAGIAGTITTLDALDTAQDTQHATTQAAIAALNDLSAAEVNTEVDTALADIHLDHLLAVDYDPAAKPGTATALLNELVENDAGVSRFTVNALENAPSGTGASAETIADAVWDELLSGHTGAGSAGKALSDLATAVAENQTDLDAILLDLTDGTVVVGSISADAVNASALATDAVQEIRNAITGGAYALDTDANGRVRIVDGVGAGEISLTGGFIDWNAAWDAEVQSEVEDGLAVYDPPTRAELTTDTNSILDKLLKYFQLALRSDAAIAADNAAELTAINADGGSGLGDYSNQAEALEALRDRGDAAWITATGFSTHSAADVWSVVTRTLTALDEDITTLDLDATIRAAVGLAAADLDAQIAGLPTQAEITGGVYALDTDANGRVRVVDGTAAGEISLTLGLIDGITGTINTFDALDTAQDAQHATTQAAIAALNDLSAAQVNAEVDTALADIHLDHLLAVDYDPAAKPGTATALLNELVESDAGVSRFTANALENAPTGGAAPTAAAVADAVWDELLSGHTIPGSAGITLADLTTAVAENQTDLNSILAGVAENQTDLNSILLDLTDGTVLVGSISADAVSASALATDAVQEIRNAITGGAYALDTDANGRVRIVDGTAAGELNTDGGYIAGIAGTINTFDALDTAQDTQHATTQAAVATLNDISVADVLTTQMTEVYAADGTVPTLTQALLAIHQHLMDFEISGTDYIVYKFDGTTEAYRGTLNSTTPSEQRRTSV